MEIIIKGNAKEIAALVFALQERRGVDGKAFAQELNAKLAQQFADKSGCEL